MRDNFFIEVDCAQKNHYQERICGDVFLTGRIKEENRIVVVLSDGMGHGIKANVLATLTATMALKFTEEHKAPEKTAEIIMNTLPECSDRRMNYSTFSIIDIEHEGKTTILEYDNPQTIIVRGAAEYIPEWKTITLESERNKGKTMRVCSFIPQKGDRIIFCSDGITQSGMGTTEYLLGWGIENLTNFTINSVKMLPDISARNLSSRIINMAYRNDNYQLKDDSSAGSIYFREPRKLMICTGPPYNKEDDKKLATAVKVFDGKKIVMGATTGDVISRELKLTIQDKFDFQDSELPPMAFMEGIDLFTEGILTLAKVEQLLLKYSSNLSLGFGPADQIVKLIQESDEIDFIVGTRVNIAHQDPLLPIELEIRRTVVNRVARLLEEKLLKKVSVRFI